MTELFNKLKWVAGLVVVFLLILATNLIDRQHFVRVKDALITIYEDRLVVKGYVYNLSRILEEKRIALAASDAAFFEKRNSVYNDSLDVLIEKFYDTKLTDEEKRYLDDFSSKVDRLEKEEQKYSSSEVVSSDNKTVLEQQLLSLKKDLDALAGIQLDEGKRQLYIATRSVDTIELFTRMEIIALIIIGIIVQVIILYKPREK
jgi:hypothetical protein